MKFLLRKFSTEFFAPIITTVPIITAPIITAFIPSIIYLQSPFNYATTFFSVIFYGSFMYVDIVAVFTVLVLTKYISSITFNYATTFFSVIFYGSFMYVDIVAVLTVLVLLCQPYCIKIFTLLYILQIIGI